MKSGVIDIDRGMKAMVRRFIRYKRGPYVTVGIQGTEAEEEREFGETNVTLAVVHEFGSKDGRIPQRSFIRSTIDRERNKIQKLLDRSARRALTSADVLHALGEVGEFTKSQMVRTIDQSIGLKKLAKSTELAKKSTKPLIDTGILKGSITWKVHKK